MRCTWRTSPRKGYEFGDSTCERFRAGLVRALHVADVEVASEWRALAALRGTAGGRRRARFPCRSRMLWARLRTLRGVLLALAREPFRKRNKLRSLNTLPVAIVQAECAGHAPTERQAIGACAFFR